MNEAPENIVILTTDVVAAYVSHNSLAIGDLPILIRTVHGALGGLGGVDTTPTVEQTPAVSIRASVKPDHIACLNCGKKMKMLKRHLSTEHQLTIPEYRTLWNLPESYPMVAPAYRATRQALAHVIGLGRSRTGKKTIKRK